jgi:tetratricopeptide (TPR) repeat protein
MARLTRFWEQLRATRHTRYVRAEFDAAEAKGDLERCLSIHHRIAASFARDNGSATGIEPRLWIHVNIRLAEILRVQRASSSQVLPYYKEALRHLTVDADPRAWAMIQINMGYLSAGNEAAVRHYHQALGAVTQHNFPREWALAHSNLCALYLDSREGPNRDEKLRDATVHGEQALSVITRKEDPARWGTIQINLGAAYSQLLDSANALRTYQSALQVFDPYRDAGEWARVQLYIGHLHRRQFDTAIDKARRESHYADASRHYRLAQTVTEARQDLVAHRDVLHSLGMLQFDYGAWQEAAQTLRLAIQANSILLDHAFTETERHAILAESWSLTPALAYALLRTGKYLEAFFEFDRTNTRALSESVIADKVEKALREPTRTWFRLLESV